MNVHVSRIARQQASMGGFAPEATPSPPSPVASDSEDENDDDGDDFFFCIHFLIITPLQSLVLDFCYLFLSILLYISLLISFFLL